MKLIIIELSVLFSCVALFLSTEYLILNANLLSSISENISTSAQESDIIKNTDDTERRTEYLSRHNLSAAIYQSITDEN